MASAAPQTESRQFRQRWARAFRKLLWSPGLGARGWMRLAPLLIGALAGGWILAGGIGGAKRLREANDRRERMAAQAASLDAERRRLEEAIRRLEEDPNALELLAKSELHLAAPDEIVVLLPEATPDQ